MVSGINKEVISFLFKGDLPQQTAQKFKQELRQENLQLSKDEIPNSENMNREAGRTAASSNGTIVRDMPKINRNDVTIQNVANGQTK
jgi:preprotein translocase subunit SecA